MKLTQKEVVKTIKGLEDLGVKEEKYISEIKKKFKTTEITILHFFTAEIKKKVINIKSIFFFVFGLILIVLGILAGTIVALFGLALFILSIAMIMEKIKIKKLYKKLITLINKQD